MQTCRHFTKGAVKVWPLTGKKYNIIYADPPWRYRDKCLHKGGAERHYRTMSMDNICSLPVADIAAENSALFIWVTMPMLFEAARVIEAWGFEYKTCGFVWVKTYRRTNPKQLMIVPEDLLVFDGFIGMGHWTRANAELCLLATKGKPKRMSGRVREVVYAPVGRHSEKPAEVRRRIVKLMGDLPRIELFARKTTPGWDAWGNEVESMNNGRPKQCRVAK